MSPAMPIQSPATTTTTGRRARHIAAAADQSCRASSFAVAAMIRSARSFDASRFAVIVVEASPATCSTAFSTRSSVRFSIRCTAPPTWLKSFWFAAACALSPSIAEAVAARFFCASATKLRDAAFKLSPLRLCANSPSVLAISFCLLSILAILADTSLEGEEVDAGAVIRSSRLVVSSSMTFTNPARFCCCAASVAILVFCASTASRIEVNSSIVSGLPSGGGDCTGPFCCFSLSSAALMFLLLLLLVVVEERLRALRGEVRRECARALAALGAPGLAAAVLDVERPGLLPGALALLADGAVQPHPRHPLPVIAELLVLLVDHRFETGLVHRAGIGQGSAHPVAHLAVERSLGEVLAAQLPVLRRVLQTLHRSEERRVGKAGSARRARSL